jgi:hypothetical protein
MDQQKKQPRNSFWNDLEDHLENPRFRRSCIRWSLHLQGASRWQVLKYLIKNRRKT